MKTLHLALAAAAVAALAPLAWSLQEDETAVAEAPAWSGERWEYKVVGMTDLHSSTFEYLKGALKDKEGGILGVAKAADDQLAAKTEDLLNALGQEGWDLLHYSSTSIILKRPQR